MSDGPSRVDLVSGFIAGTLDEERQDTLLRRVQADPRVLDQLRRQSAMHGILTAERGPPLDADAVMARLDDGASPVERAVMGYVTANQPSSPVRVGPATVRRGWRPHWSAALGWVTAAATAGFFIATRPHSPPIDQTPPQPSAAQAPRPAAIVAQPPSGPRDPFAMVTSASSGVWILGDGEPRPAHAGATLLSGEGLVAGSGDSRATLLLSDGARVDLGPDTVLTRVSSALAGETRGGRLFLARGAVQVLRAPRHPAAAGELRIEAPHGSVLLTSARVRVQVGAEGTRVDVNAGRARFTPLGRPATEVEQGQYALTAGQGKVTRGSRGSRRALLLTGARNLGPSDVVIRARMERLGFEVASTTATALDLSAASDSTLLVVSSTVSPQDVDVGVRDLPVPIVTWEVGLYPVLGMTGRCDEGACGFHQLAPFSLDLKDPGHPLAAQQTGTIDLRWLDRIAWGTPNANAAWVASVTGQPTRAAIFAYERGAIMPGLAAPARRVGFFFHDSSAETLPRDAVAWQLFDRALLWCLD